MLLAVSICPLLLIHQKNESQNRLSFTIKLNTEYKVQVADQMTRQHLVKAGTRRWPVAMFYSILDLASVNAFMLKGRTKTKLPLETKS